MRLWGRTNLDQAVTEAFDARSEEQRLYREHQKAQSAWYNAKCHADRLHEKAEKLAAAKVASGAA